MTEQREYRYTPPQAPGPCSDHPNCLVLRCRRLFCERTFHQPLIQRGQPAATAARPAASPNTADSARDHRPSRNRAATPGGTTTRSP